jgi:hypothetical protein
VLIEIALAVVLLIGAALLIRTSIALGGVERGFSANNVLLLRTSLAGTRYASTANVEQAIRAARERLLSMPGVVEVGTGHSVPARFDSNLPFNVVGRDLPQGEFSGGADYAVAGPGYFATFRTPLLRAGFHERRGRARCGDGQRGVREALLPGDALSRAWIGGAIYILAAARAQIVGIWRRPHQPGVEPAPTMYVQARSRSFNAFSSAAFLLWAVHTAAPDGRRGDRGGIREVTGVIIDTETMERRCRDARKRFNMLLMSISAARRRCRGARHHGLLAYSVEQRTGFASRRAGLCQIGGIVLRQGGVLVGAGVVGGLCVGSTSNLLASFLFGVEPRDGPVFIAVPVVLMLIGLSTVAIVARRAGRVDPLESLRHD